MSSDALQIMGMADTGVCCWPWCLALFLATTSTSSRVSDRLVGASPLYSTLMSVGGVNLILSSSSICVISLRLLKSGKYPLAATSSILCLMLAPAAFFLSHTSS
jgi:hypothetical protein